MAINEQARFSAPLEAAPALVQQLSREWHCAVNGDEQIQARWRPQEDGNWLWQADGLHARRSAAEWLEMCWQGWNAQSVADLNNFIVEVTVCGKADAAGLSFGPYKDFLTRLDRESSAKRLQLEVDVTAGSWAFRVNGRLMERAWWDCAVENVGDLLNGVLTLKTRGVEEAFFQDLTIHTFQASCQLTVISTCYRFVQRLRISLRNWCYQDLPSGAYEVLIVNPDSADGTHEHMAAVARSFPNVRVREVAVASKLATNKGAMINRALELSRGEWVWLTDADCLFAPYCARETLDKIDNRHDRLYYGQRKYLTAAQTDSLLSGRTDGLSDFEQLAFAANFKPAENFPWGYSQIVHHSVLRQVRYRENLHHFAHTDGMFVEDCRRKGIFPMPIEGLFCLH